MVDIFGVESFREYQEGKKLSTNVIIDALQDQGLGARPLKMIAEKTRTNEDTVVEDTAPSVKRSIMRHLS